MGSSFVLSSLIGIGCRVRMGADTGGMCLISTSLDLSRLPLQTIWHESVPLFKSFCSLGKEELTFKDCHLLEEVFNFEWLNCNEDDATPFFPLQRLVLTNLSSLKSIWKNAPRGSPYFRHLKQLSISKCNRLKSIFAPSIAMCLVGLEKMEISVCLQSLCNLESFYFGSHVSICPSLKDLDMNTFASANSIGNSKVGKGVLFGEADQNHAEKLTRLSVLKLRQANQIEHLLEEDYYNDVISGITNSVFQSLKTVKLSHCDRLKAPLFPCWLSLKNLTILSVDLELVSLPNLTSFCSVDQCTTNFDLPGLRNAVVAYCNELKFFCHGDVSAPKLRTVEMDYDYKALAREGL
ncbi:hypothetical protein TIFTF001_046222 [Ficus carica]|uniref:Disease resistance protein At4g27190-like leucine-rich repeats domain-containing protein n=1 Tax=Ficus carica TaxID=3494 RepID=A0AA87Z8T9_FICCA|nr:hypothetical protein TIFTF001_046222 [Ficus carica]